MATANEQDELIGLVDALCRGALTDAQMDRLAARGPEAMRLVILAANARLAAARGAGISVSTPSGMIPIYHKPSVAKRNKKPGARKGHTGTRRDKPAKIDAHQEHRLAVCPCCSGELQRCNRTRKRVIEDIPAHITPVVTEHTVHRDYCPHCKKHVEPVVPDAMPKASLGHNLMAFSAWCHYGLSVTLSQVRDILGSHLHTHVSGGGLIDGWKRLADALLPWYQQIAREAKDSAVLHADETGWRVDGQTHWLWCFVNHRNCYYMIDKRRGGTALQRFFTEAFGGTLVHDFWAAYEQVSAEDRQYCLVHLLRELEKVDEHNDAPEWLGFAKQLRRLIRDGIRLRKRKDFTPQKYDRRIKLIHRRLCALADEPRLESDSRRLTERLSRHRDHLFTFLDRVEVPFENNTAERAIRPAVIIRKNSLCNRSERGALTQAVLMSVFRTLRLRGHDPTSAIANALRSMLQNRTLPNMPAEIVAGG